MAAEQLQETFGNLLELFLIADESAVDRHAPQHGHEHVGHRPDIDIRTDVTSLDRRLDRRQTKANVPWFVSSRGSASPGDAAPSTTDVIRNAAADRSSSRGFQARQHVRANLPASVTSSCDRPALHSTKISLVWRSTSGRAPPSRK